MKKRWLFILAVLMIAATMFVACNSEVTDAGASAQPGKELVYATFGGGSKSLTTEYSFIDYTQLYWFYQAEKKDSYGTTGAVTGTAWAKVPGNANRKGLDGTVGPFSQGLWAFKLRGYETEYSENPGEGKYDIAVQIGGHTYYYSGLVYSGESTGTGTGKNEVNLKYGNSNAIPVTVAPAGTTGKIALGTSTAPLVYSWYQSNGGTGALKLKVTVTPQSATSATDSWDIYYDLNSYQYHGYIYAKGSKTSTDLPTGNYNLEFTVCAVDTNNNVAYEFANQSLSLTVFGSQTTYVKGNLVEGLFVENAHFVATDVASVIVIPTTTGANFETTKTPAGSGENKKTTVSVPTGTLTKGSQNNMTIEVVSVDIAQEVATAVDFVIKPEETSNIAVAAIDITLKQVTTTTDSSTGDVTVEEASVKNFTQPVTITTYISPNLTGVKVRYNVQPGDLDVSQPNAGGTSADPTVAAILESAESTGLGYHPASGLLRFQTTHFSQFFVISDSEAQNVTTGVYYSTLKEAFEKAEKDQTVRVYKDNVTISEVSTYVKTGYECVVISEKGFLVREKTICSHGRRAGTFCLDCKYPVANVPKPSFVSNVKVLAVMNQLNMQSVYHMTPYRDESGALNAGSIKNENPFNENNNPCISTGVLFDFIASWEDNWNNDNINYRPNYPFAKDTTMYGFDNQSNIVVTQGNGLTADNIFDLFSSWGVDYVCSFSDEIAKGTCSLVGYYESYGACVVISLPQIHKDEEFPLLGSAGLGSGMKYKDICNTVKDFQCGIFSSDSSNNGTTFTVRLRMTKPDGWNQEVISAMSKEPFKYSSEQIHSLLPTLLDNDYIDVCTVTYTIGRTGSTSYSIH